jgi:hypothetical protein
MWSGHPQGTPRENLTQMPSLRDLVDLDQSYPQLDAARLLTDAASPLAPKRWRQSCGTPAVPDDLRARTVIMTAELRQPLVLLTALAQGDSIAGESRLRVPWQTNQFDSQLSIATRTALAARTGADRPLMFAALTLAAPDNAAQQVSAAGESIDDADWLAAATSLPQSPDQRPLCRCSARGGREAWDAGRAKAARGQTQTMLEIDKVAGLTALSVLAREKRLAASARIKAAGLVAARNAREGPALSLTLSEDISVTLDMRINAASTAVRLSRPRGITALLALYERGA